MTMDSTEYFFSNKWAVFPTPQFLWNLALFSVLLLNEVSSDILVSAVLTDCSNTTILLLEK